MGLPTSITITNPQVNSGNTIKINATTINTNIDCYTNTQDKPNDYNDAYNTRLSYGTNTGFKNPDITIQGAYELGATHETGSNAALDYEHVKDLIQRSDQTLTLISDFFKTTSNSTGTKNVMLTNITISNNNASTCDFTMNLIEVRSDT